MLAPEILLYKNIKQRGGIPSFYTEDRKPGGILLIP
jgi:hypothetical protein